MLVNLSLHFKQLIIIHLLYWNPRCINNNISPKKILRILIQYFISMCVMLNILDEAFFSNFFCPLVNHNLLASFIEISSAAIGVSNYFHSSRVVCLFFFIHFWRRVKLLSSKETKKLPVYDITYTQILWLSPHHASRLVLPTKVESKNVESKKIERKMSKIKCRSIKMSKCKNVEV